jgi:hypothetical protein
MATRTAPPSLLGGPMTEWLQAPDLIPQFFSVPEACGTEQNHNVIAL